MASRVKKRLILRQSKWTLVLRLILIQTLITLFYVTTRVGVLILSNLNISSDIILNARLVEITVFLSLSVLQMALTVFTLLKWSNESFEITKRILIHRSGFLNVTEHTFSLTGINNLVVYQNFLAKYLKYGSIVFFNPITQQNFYISNIPNPDQAKEGIQRLINEPGTDMVFPAQTTGQI